MTAAEGRSGGKRRGDAENRANARTAGRAATFDREAAVSDGRLFVDGSSTGLQTYGPYPGGWSR